jgi:hypothetical protein
MAIQRHTGAAARFALTMAVGILGGVGLITIIEHSKPVTQGGHYSFNANVDDDGALRSFTLSMTANDWTDMQNTDYLATIVKLAVSKYHDCQPLLDSVKHAGGRAVVYGHCRYNGFAGNAL